MQAKGKKKSGRDRDPGWDHLSSPAMSAWRKVFVEPVPQMFKKLEDAVQRVSNATVVNAAISRRTGRRWMYCPSMDGDGRLVVAGVSGRLPQWLDETCSMDPSRFTDGSGGSRGGEGRIDGMLGARSKRRLRRNIHRVRVEGVTMSELARREGISPAEVQYVQVDAGGFDDSVVRQVLAMGSAGPGVQRRTTAAATVTDAEGTVGGVGGGGGGGGGCSAHPSPAVIVYDTDLLNAARQGGTLRLLHLHGYATCRQGENTMAVRMSSLQTT